MVPEGDEMTTRVMAVFENGVLRPASPLPLAEGQMVRVTVETASTLPLKDTEEETIERINSARTLEELFAVLNHAPEDESGYDLCKALDENRRQAGVSRLLFPATPKGKTE
jgi:predicted DNA-binding antitoxin AbrB/MazE fold protein